MIENLELIGRLIICVSIIASIIMFAKVNADYQPSEKEKKEHLD